MISSNRSLTLVPALAFVLGSFAATPPSFNPESYLKHIKFLAGDELKGRGNGTPELDKAADYIAGEFKSAGIQPAGDGGGYFQKFLVATGSRLGPGNKLTMQLGTAQTTAAALKDFLPFGVGEKTSVSGGIVFAGYGITAKEHGYDDYKGLDANDKIVLVMAHEPRENDPGSPFNGKELTIHG